MGKIYENGKLFNKVNIVDLIIILIACLMLYGFYDRYSEQYLGTKKQNLSEKSQIGFSYTMKISKVSESTFDMIQKGDYIYDKATSSKIGEIVDVKKEVARDVIETANGEIVYAEVPTKLDITLMIDAEGSVKNSEYLAGNNTRILIGENKQIKTKFIESIGVVTNIEKMEE